MAKKTYLICEINKGMFPNEKCVVVKNPDGSIISSGFFPNHLIKENKLSVYVLETQGDSVSRT